MTLDTATGIVKDCNVIWQLVRKVGALLAVTAIVIIASYLTNPSAGAASQASNPTYPGPWDPLFWYAWGGGLLSYILSPRQEGFIQGLKGFLEEIMQFDRKAGKEILLMFFVAFVAAFLVVIVGEPTVAKQATIMGMTPGALVGPVLKGSQSP